MCPSAAEYHKYISKLKLGGKVLSLWTNRAFIRLWSAQSISNIPAAALLGHLKFWHIWIVAFLAGILTVFFQIASIAMLPAVVEREQLVEANAKLAMTDSVISIAGISIAGPAVAGGFVQLISAPEAIVVDALSYVFSALTIGRRNVSGETPHRRSTGVRAEVAEGIRELVRTPVLRLLTITSSLGIFASALQSTVLVLFLARELQLSAALIGIAFGAAGVGSLLTAACAGRIVRLTDTGWTLIVGKVTMLLGGFILAIAGLVGHRLVFVLVAQFLIGAGGTVYIVTQVSLRQRLTPTGLMGRVTAARRFILYSTALAGAALAGYLGGAIGLRPTLLVAAAALGLELLVLATSSIRGVR